MNNVAKGLLAGSAGTVVLHVVTSLDVAGRGRPESEVPGGVAAALSDKAGFSLGSDPDAADHRKSGLGALAGYVTGLGVGAFYGLVRPRTSRLSWPVAGVLAGLGAMAASDAPATALGITDPREWGVSGFLSDLIPHLSYGLATSAVFSAIR